MDRLAHIQKLEQRIRRQRAQLRWWNERFARREVVAGTRYGWTASRVCELLRRLGSPHRVDVAGRVSRRANTSTREPKG